MAAVLVSPVSPHALVVLAGVGPRLAVRASRGKRAPGSGSSLACGGCPRAHAVPVPDVGVPVREPLEPCVAHGTILRHVGLEGYDPPTSGQASRAMFRREGPEPGRDGEPATRALQRHVSAPLR